jgi:Holliday junction DNA helicase RuvB
LAILGVPRDLVASSIAPSSSIAQESLNSLGIDEYGLDDMDRSILSTLIDKFDGGPVGVNSLSVAVSEDASTIEDVYEPYLIKQGFIQRTNRGRIAQEKCYKLLTITITIKHKVTLTYLLLP